MRKKSKGLLFTMIMLMVLVSFSYMVAAMGTEPGSEEDPIVTKSYVELRNQQLKFYIEENINRLKESMGNTTSSVGQATSVFEVVHLLEGQKVTLGASAEIIVRAGKASVIQSEAGGLANVTIGKDLQGGTMIPLNHLLINPRADERGVQALTECYFMIKGSYSIQ